VPLEGEAAVRAGRLWLFGAAATLVASVAWLYAVLRAGDGRRIRAGS